MHAENRYPVTASLFMLKEIKHRQEQVNRGYQLLKRKVEALRIRGRQAALELSSTQAVLGHTLKEAYISLAAIKFTNGESNALVLENVGQVSQKMSHSFAFFNAFASLIDIQSEVDDFGMKYYTMEE